MARVLVVDDGEDNRDLLATVLGYGGYEVSTAENGEAGLRAIRASPPDLVITDILMPIMDGYELVRELRADAATAAMPVVFCTAYYLRDEVTPVAEACGVRHLIPKPSEPGEILAVVARALAEASSLASAPPTVPPPDDAGFGREQLRANSAKLLEKVRDLEATEAALRASEVRFRTLADAAPVGIASVRADGTAIYTNRRLAEICGRESIPSGTSPFEIIHTDDRELVAAFLAAGAPAPVRLRVVQPSGVIRWVDAVATPLDGTDDGAALLVAVQDVTDVVDAEEQKRALDERLRVSERLESLGQLAGGVAHDFNNLLAVIINYAQFVSEGLDELPAHERLSTMQDDLAQVKLAGDRAAALTRQLLIFGRREVIRPQRTDLTQTMGRLEGLLRRTIGEEVELTIVTATDLPATQLDGSRFEQVVLNLVVNARDALAGPGHVRVSLNAVDIDADTAEAHGVPAAGRYVCLNVDDDGQGMPPHVAAHAFDPFFTTKPAGSGTGLGLATVFSITKEWAGAAAIYSEEGRGTRVRIYIPSATGTAPEDRPVPPAPRAGAGQQVLVVEDELVVLLTVRRILTAAGYEVLAASSPSDALDLLGSMSDPPALLFTDLMMPGMSGMALAAQSTAMYPALAVLFMSGFPAGMLGPDRRLPADVHLLQKPFSSVDLLSAVEGALDAPARR